MQQNKISSTPAKGKPPPRTNSVYERLLNKKIERESPTHSKKSTIPSRLSPESNNTSSSNCHKPEKPSFYNRGHLSPPSELKPKISLIPSRLSSPRHCDQTQKPMQPKPNEFYNHGQKNINATSKPRFKTRDDPDTDLETSFREFANLSIRGNA